jgi:hypothetical protein
MAGDFNKPVTTDAYTSVLTYVRDMFADLAKLMDGTGTANTPTNAIRWNGTTKRFEKYSGTVWNELIVKATDKYDINVDRVDGYDVGNASGNIPLSNGTRNVNENADMVDGAHAGTAAGNVLVLDGSGLVPVANLPTVTAAKGGTGQTGYTTGDLLYASGASALSKLAAVAAGSVLASNGAGAAPVWTPSPTIGTQLIVTGAGANNCYGIHLRNATPYISMWDTDNSRKWLMGTDADAWWVYRATTQSENATDWVARFRVSANGEVTSNSGSVSGGFFCGSTTYPYLQNNGTDSVLAWDASDYFHYIKASNQLKMYVGGVEQFMVDSAAGISGKTLNLTNNVSGSIGPGIGLFNHSGTTNSATQIAFVDSFTRNQIYMYVTAGGSGNYNFNLHRAGVGFVNVLNAYGDTQNLQMYSVTFYKPGGGAFTDSSDERIKHNIIDYQLGLDEILTLRPREFSFKPETGRDPNQRFVSFVAQEVQQTPFADRMLGTIEFKNERTNEVILEDCLTLNPSDLPYALVNAVKELSAKLDAANARIATLEARG